MVEGQWESWAQPGEGRSAHLLFPMWVLESTDLESMSRSITWNSLFPSGDPARTKQQPPLLGDFTQSPFCLSFIRKFLQALGSFETCKFCKSQVWPCLFRARHSVELYLFIYHRVVSFPRFSGPGAGWADDRVGCPELMTSPYIHKLLYFCPHLTPPRCQWAGMNPTEGHCIPYKKNCSLGWKCFDRRQSSRSHTAVRLLALGAEGEWRVRGGGARAIVGLREAQPSTRSWVCCPLPRLCSSSQTRGLTPSPFPTISSPWEGNHLMVHWRRRKGALEKCYDNRKLFSVGTIWCAGVTKEAVIECPGTPFGPK